MGTLRVLRACVDLILMIAVGIVYVVWGAFQKSVCISPILSLPTKGQAYAMWDSQH